MTDSKKTILDDAFGGMPLEQGVLRQALSQERVPLKRLPLMQALLQAFSAKPRRRMAELYAFDENRKPTLRKKDNAAAIALLAQIEAGDISEEALTDEHRAVLAKYSGTGGALIGADGKKGSAYEYYTPLPIAEGIYSALAELGFSGGKVLDPCAGTGIFGAAAPASAVVDAVELNETSGRVNHLVNSAPGYSVTVSPFERIAASTPDEAYDAVVSNVPFGKVSDRGGNQHLDPRYQKEPLESYFIRRSIEKLKPGGLAAFIAPTRCVTGRGDAEVRMRRDVAYVAEFIGAFRLPNSVFNTAATDTMTDVVFYRKYSADAAQRIEELSEQNPEVLTQAGVLWPEYLSGEYFRGEGARYVLGNLERGKGQWGEVDVLTTNASVGEIGKLLRKLPASRINWGLLNAAETLPILYAEGDTIYQRGQLLEMKAGQWVPVGAADESMQAFGEQLGQLRSPYAAFESGLQMGDAVALVERANLVGQGDAIPDWARKLIADVQANESGKQAAIWQAALVGMSVDQVIGERAQDGEITNYLADYGALSKAMKLHASVGLRHGSFKGEHVKNSLRKMIAQYKAKTGYAAFWRGDIEAEVKSVDPITADRSFEGLRYELKSVSVPLAQARKVLGEYFDPLQTDDYCVTGDGSAVIPAADYYSGNYGDFLRRIDAEIASATSNDPLRQKLLRQKLLADQRVNRLDVGAMEFNLFSPLVSAEEKAEFLRRFVHPEAVVVYDEVTGKARPDIQISQKSSRGLSDVEKLKNRIGDYLQNGTITLANAKLDMDKDKALRTLSEMVRTANEQFNVWVRSNDQIKARLQSIGDDPNKLRFQQEAVEAPLAIHGWGAGIKLHGYQNAFVRQQAREFGGGNGFDVGLGKTASALAAVQYVQSIGVKKKTVFVVPGAVLSNWRKEAGKALASTDDCLYVGLSETKGGGFSVSSARYDDDLNAIRENRHAKIFMTYEAFQRLRLRDQTIEDFGAFMRRVDSSFAEVQDKKKDEKNKGKAAGFRAILKDKEGSAPYLEDLGIDSIVIDEGHAFKNSSQTSEFKGGKYLSIPESSQRGLDMQAKAWYIRGLSARKDGVLVLTASPITNSPLEVYSMLALSVGHERLNDMMMGAQGADSFMKMVCAMSTERERTMDGIEREMRVFKGLDNVALLRAIVHSSFTIKNAEQVGMDVVVPDKAEHAPTLKLPEEINSRLRLYKDAFRFAIDTVSEKASPGGSEEAYKEVAAHFGEPLELIAHPFNLINKMTMLILDPELDQRISSYTVPMGQEDKLAALVAKFNEKKVTEKAPRLPPGVPEDAIVSRKKIKEDGGETSEELTIHVRATAAEINRVNLASIEPSTQQVFEAMAEKMGVDLDVSVPPKMAALLDNYVKERANPRGIDAEGNKSPLVKQIVFCDVLPMHSKIKRILTKRGGTPASAIAIITGQINNSPEEILDVQDGFNAHGEGNKYQTVLANEKAEVGINLQIGTQAIHHTTIGWTPDSLQQRNGRGVRQGNKTAYLNVYHYDADGTFDIAKRSMVNKKADWISKVLSAEGGNRIAVSGGMSREQMHALVDCIGDADGTRRAQEQADEKAKAQRIAETQDKQRIHIEAIEKQREFLRLNEAPLNIAANAVVNYRDLKAKLGVVAERAKRADDSAKGVRVLAMEQELAARVNGLREVLEASLQFADSQGHTVGIDTFLSIQGVTYAGLPKKSDEIREELGYGRGRYKMTVIEGTPLHADWEADIGMAQKMIQESARSIESLSGDEGGLSAALGQAAVRGEVGKVNGQYVMTGDFLQDEQGKLLGVVVANLRDKPVVLSFNKNGRQDESYFRHIGGWSLVRQGDPRYLELLKEAAQQEDKWTLEGEPTDVYSKCVPEVGQYRSTAQRLAFSRSKHALPAPHFPYVIAPSAAAQSEVQKRIFEEQKALVLGFTQYGEFIVEKTTPVIDRTNSNHLLPLVAYAKANGMKLAVSDIDRQPALGLARAIYEAGGLTDEDVQAAFGAAFVGHESVDAFLAAVLDVFVKLAPWVPIAEWIDVDALQLQLGNMISGLPGMSELKARYDSAYVAAKNAAAAAAAAASTLSESAQGDSDSDSDSDFVGVSGQTMVWKDRIKSFAGAGNFRWDGGAEVWNIPRAAWLRLVEVFPAASEQLKAGAPSKKLPAKK